MNSTLQIFPSLISADILNLKTVLQQLDDHCDGYHIDVMDDHFVPNLTWGPAFVNAIRKATKRPLHIHLMVDNPASWVERIALEKADTFIFHHEVIHHEVMHPLIEKVKQKASRLVEKGDILLITSENNILVNALQRSSSVIIQKSLREGFGLVISEALWKEKPVVASNVGGIPLQVNEENGFLVEPTDTKGFVDRVIEIMRHPELAKEMGKKARSKSSAAQGRYNNKDP